MSSEYVGTTVVYQEIGEKPFGKQGRKKCFAFFPSFHQNDKDQSDFCKIFILQSFRLGPYGKTLEGYENVWRIVDLNHYFLFFENAIENTRAGSPRNFFLMRLVSKIT